MYVCVCCVVCVFSMCMLRRRLCIVCALCCVCVCCVVCVFIKCVLRRRVCIVYSLCMHECMCLYVCVHLSTSKTAQKLSGEENTALIIAIL